MKYSCITSFVFLEENSFSGCTTLFLPLVKDVPVSQGEYLLVAARNSTQDWDEAPVVLLEKWQDMLDTLCWLKGLWGRMDLILYSDLTPFLDEGEPYEIAVCLVDAEVIEAFLSKRDIPLGENAEDILPAILTAYSKLLPSVL